MDYLESLQDRLRYHKELAEKTFEQLDEEQLFWSPGAASNSIAVIVKHMAGNMLSRFTDFLTTDGEKPWRNRDGEFYTDFSTREEMLETWEKGWQCVLDCVAGLGQEDMQRTVSIRNEEHSVVQALNRQLAHYAYHVGQILFIGKMIKDEDWKTLSIPHKK